MTVVAFATIAPQANPSRPEVVERTATGTVPGAMPAGTGAERPQLMPLVTVPLPDTCPVTAQTWLAALPHGTPAWPLVWTCAMACWRVRLAAVAVGLGVAGV